ARGFGPRADVFRLWLAPDGTFTDDPAGSDLAPTTDFGPVDSSSADAGTYYRITTGALSIRVHKAPLRFSVLRAHDSTPLWEESPPTGPLGREDQVVQLDLPVGRGGADDERAADLA
ncbi:hypothetical protein ADK55_22190, partial [Streptomyces sp. WM4235]